MIKVGDKVKVIDPSFTSSQLDSKYRGRIGVVVKIIEGHDWPYFVDFDEGDGEEKWFGDEEISKVGKGRPHKSVPIQFVVGYKEHNKDPLEVFTTQKNLEDWLKDAKDNEDIDFSSIRVFKVLEEYKVDISIKLKLK